MPDVSAIVLGGLAFVAMEPVTAMAHRWLMHGVGARLHRSHHRGGTSGWEDNDWFPVMFAALVMGGLALGFNVDHLGALVPIGLGVSLYGLAYAMVHDVYIHGRIPWLRGRRWAALERLADAHRIHHLFGGAPYGMLLPVVPGELRARSATSERDPFAHA